jgi:hypothetical protein
VGNANVYDEATVRQIGEQLAQIATRKAMSIVDGQGSAEPATPAREGGADCD